jgi:hypothetical protein
MSWHTYHTHTRMPERLALNQKVFSYLSIYITYDMELKKYLLIFQLVRKTTTTIMNLGKL